MIVGIGTDIFEMSRIPPQVINDNDPFLMKSFTAAERAAAVKRPVPQHYYASRFAGKEAIYKAISICGLEFDAGEIEILNDSDDRPHAQLLGKTALEFSRVAPGYRIFVSLSFEKEFASAFAVAEV